jgi:large subunit ribosomal protein L3
MKHAILGRKLGMTQIFDHQGNAIPVTIIQAGPCRVLQVKTTGTDGYNAVQLGFLDKKEKRTTQPLKGHFKKAGSLPQRHVRETRVEDPSLFSVGQVITCGLFFKGDFVDITGTSKGKGFAGVMKRHNFKGFLSTHGTHESRRGPGSVGQAADPAKTFKGIKMAGQLGVDTVTVQNVLVVDNREGQNLLLVRGPVPGGKNGLLLIRHSTKKPAPPERKAEPVPAEEPGIETAGPGTAPEPVETDDARTEEAVQDAQDNPVENTEGKTDETEKTE